MNATAAKSLQSCLTLCDPIDGSLPGFAIPGILQAKTLEWIAICFSNECKWKVKVKSLIRVRPFATPWTAAYQAPPSLGFSRQEYWSGVPLPSPYVILTGYKSSTVQNQVTKGHKRKCEKTREGLVKRTFCDHFKHFTHPYHMTNSIFMCVMISIILPNERMIWDIFYKDTCMIHHLSCFFIPVPPNYPQYE